MAYDYFMNQFRDIQDNHAMLDFQEIGVPKLT